MEAIVRRCLEPDPARRYQSGHELQEDIERQLTNDPLKHAPEPSLCGAGRQVAAAASGPVEHRPRSRPWPCWPWSSSARWPGPHGRDARTSRARLAYLAFREDFEKCQLLLNTSPRAGSNRSPRSGASTWPAADGSLPRRRPGRPGLDAVHSVICRETRQLALPERARGADPPRGSRPDSASPSRRRPGETLGGLCVGNRAARAGPPPRAASAGGLLPGSRARSWPCWARIGGRGARPRTRRADGASHGPGLLSLRDLVPGHGPGRPRRAPP